MKRIEMMEKDMEVKTKVEMQIDEGKRARCRRHDPSLRDLIRI